MKTTNYIIFGRRKNVNDINHIMRNTYKYLYIYSTRFEEFINS